jgi:hypothetical protein
VHDVFPGCRFAISTAAWQPPTIAELDAVLTEQGLTLPPDSPPVPFRADQ